MKSRSLAAFAAWLALPVLAQQESPWDVLPPGAVSDRNVVPNSPALIKSLGDAAEYVLRWKLPGDAEGWRIRRVEVERAFRRAIGLERLPERTPLNSRVTARHDMGGYTIENVIFESRPGFPVTANLYRPKSPRAGRRPAILSPIGHFLSAGKTAADVQSRCIGLVRMGFVVLSYDAIGQGERLQAGNIHHEAGYALLPLGDTIAGWMVWDSIRAIDYLSGLADVDPERIGVTGNSGGGLNTLFTAALDQRVRAAVVVGFTYEFNNWLKYAGTHCACTHLPGLFRGMEWFEIAGLIAPRALMMLHGETDNIFPISGARRAGHNAEALYALLGRPENVRFGEIPGQPHAYSRPFREPMYGWMARHLMGQGNGEPAAEAEMTPLPEKDTRLLCDPGSAVLSAAPTVVDQARAKASDAIAKLPSHASDTARRWVRDLVAPPEAKPHHLAPSGGRRTEVPGGHLEKVSFVSEDGAYVPGLLWLPARAAPLPGTVVIVDDRGKAAVAESGWVAPLLESGYAVFAPDLRGRGETLGHHRPQWDTNYRLVANQILFGQPLAGRRAFDLIRALDYLGTRKELTGAETAVVGIGDDALPAMLAAAADDRIKSVAVSGYFRSFASQLRARAAPAGADLSRGWNDPQLKGRVNTGEYEIDFGSVIPGALEITDLPGIAALIAPRRVLFCQPRDRPNEPGDALDARRLLNWLKDSVAPAPTTPAH